MTEHKGIFSKDHLGQTFQSHSAMCRHWNIDSKLVFRRLEDGWSIKDALTTPSIPLNLRRVKKCVDHLGHEYCSQIAMCRAWGINYVTYLNRRSRKWTLEEALTKRLKKGKNHEAKN